MPWWRREHPAPPEGEAARGRAAAGPRGDRPGEPGGPLRHLLRHRHHHPGVRAAVCALRHRGAPVRAARHRLHRLDPGIAADLDHGDAGARLLSPHRPVRSRRRRQLRGRKLKAGNARLLHWAFRRPRTICAIVAFGVVAAGVGALPLPRAFLPPFNEGTILVNLQYNPGISLAESNRLGAIAERMLLEIPEVKSLGRRTGRAELDEHAEGVHNTEIDVDLSRSERSKEEVYAHIRAKLAVLPVSLSIGQPIAHRLDHMLSGVQAQIVVKIFGEDLDTLRGLAERLRARLRRGAGPRRPQSREAGADPAAQGDARLRARGPLRHHAGRADRGAGSTLGRPRRLADRRGQPPLRRRHAPLRREPLDHRAAGSAGVDTARLRAAAAAGQGRGGRRPQPDPARERPAPHRRAGQRRRQARHGGHHRRRAPRHGRDPAAVGLRHAARGHLQGPGGGRVRHRRPVARLARADLHGALPALSVGRAGRHHPDQHPARPHRQRDGAVDRRTSRCRSPR